MFKHKLFSSLLFWVVIAIIAGMLLGLVVPNWFAIPFATFNDIFGKFLGFCVPLIILGLVAPAIADLGRSAGKWLLVTTGIAYGSTLFAGFGTWLVCALVYPWLLSGEKLASLAPPEDAVKSIMDANLTFPPVFGVMTALILAFVLGVGMAATEARTMRAWFDEFRNIMMLTIKRAIVPLLPVFIFGIFLNITLSGQIASIIVTMLKIIVVAIVLSFVMLAIQYTLSGMITRQNPVKQFLTMLPAYFTALGTASSAATIPVTLAQTKKNDVAEEIADFVIPLCATIHLTGSTVKITAFSLAIIQILDLPVTTMQMVSFIFMLGITMVAAPGVPGGAIAAAQGVLVGILGFTDPAYGLMVALYIAIDSFGTACNVTGDGAIALVINKMSKGKLGKEQGRATSVARDFASSFD
ncbi:MAG: dicarboxylate/amino acid:cation symporter [Actinomycetaceae bacterium]|nr:dicarboxylate/amino acid:cation symporter [Actinomycetaceae bacterium]